MNSLINKYGSNNKTTSSVDNTLSDPSKTKVVYGNTIYNKTDKVNSLITKYTPQKTYDNFMNTSSSYVPIAKKVATDVYNATGNKGVFPRVAGTSITYKDKTGNKTIQLTPQEKQQFQQYIGQETEKQYSNINTNKSMETQAKDLQKILSKIYTNGENIILRGRGLSEK